MDLEGEIAKLEKWKAFVEKSLTSEIEKFQKYSDLLSKKAHYRLQERVTLMATEHTTAPKKVTMEQYVNLHKNLSNKTNYNYNKLFSIYDELNSKLATENRIQLEKDIKLIKENIKSRRIVKFKVLDSTKDK